MEREENSCFAAEIWFLYIAILLNVPFLCSTPPLAFKNSRSFV